MASCDLAVVGAGIVGLAHALAGLRRGLRVAVVEAERRANQASVRNFGFVTVSGQAPDWRARALRSRDRWREVAREAGIPIVQQGALVVARRPEAMAVLEQFAASELGEGCELWNRERVRRALPVASAEVHGALASPHDLRVNPREALPRLAAWLAARGVVFHWGSAAFGIEGPGLRHAGGLLAADAIVLAPGAGCGELFPEVACRVRLRHCSLQMARVAPAGDLRLPSVVMSDLSLLRYPGFAMQPATGKLRGRLERECGAALAHGVHLIVAQEADGSLVVGDSHADGEAPDPFLSEEVEALVLEELAALLALRVRVLERWAGSYPVADVAPVLRASPGKRARLVVVTAGIGISTAFALAEETMEELFA